MRDTKDPVDQIEERYRTIMDEMKDHYFETDLDGNIVFSNDLDRGNLRLSHEDLLGLNYKSMIVNDDIKMIRKAFRRIFRTAKPIRGLTVRGLNSDGTVAILEISAFPLKNVKGKIIGYRGVSRDITERVLAENELKSSREQLRNLSAHLQSVREEERIKIAREIHDELGQKLTALKMELSLFKNKEAIRSKTLKKKLTSISGLVDETIQHVKKISGELRPGSLDYFGLVPSLEMNLEDFQRRAGIRCEMDIDIGDVNVSADLSTVVFRIFQEALTNIARHANATKVRIKLKLKNGKLILAIGDNGHGITDEQISSPRSLGIIGMRERAVAWGGNISIQKKRKKGTNLVLKVPIGRT